MQVEEGNVLSYNTLSHDLSASPPLEAAPSPTTGPDTLVNPINRPWPFLPANCRWLGEGDLKILGMHPVDAGGFADVWVGEMDGQKVAVKSYRCYASVDCTTSHAEVRHT